MPVPSPMAWPTVAVRLVIAVCALTLLATAVVGSAQPSAGADLGSQISSGRRSQNYYESQMQMGDRQVAALKGQAGAARRAYKQARSAAKYTARELRTAQRIVVARRARAQTVTSLFADPSEAPKPWQYEKRLRQVRTDLRIAERRKATLGRRVRALHRASRARHARVSALRRAQRSAVYRREAAEGALGGLIERMTRLAAARVEHQTAVSLTGGSGAFSWPSTGRISQAYGCTGFRLNPPRGSCRHFHDGLDIVDSYGTAIHAAAVGVVAYSGWNPWDEGGRAWIVVVVHPDGFVSRYGHLAPSRRVQAGALVHTGQVIGKMGNTGNSTGTHLHFELLRGGSTVSPTSYLPSGVVRIRVDKKSTKKGIAAARKKARTHERKVAQRHAAKARKRARHAKETKVAKSTAEATEAIGEVCLSPTRLRAAGTGMLYAVALVSEEAAQPTVADDCTDDEAPAVTDRAAIATITSTAAGLAPSRMRHDSQPARTVGDPGVRLPPRGTSPLPF